MNISAISGLITTKFYLKHHSFEGKATLGFEPDRIRTLVSMATESSHRVILEKTGSPFFSAIFFILADNDDMHESSDKFKFRPDWTTDCGVSCPCESEKNSHRLLMGKTMSPLFLSCFSSVPFNTCM